MSDYAAYHAWLGALGARTLRVIVTGSRDWTDYDRVDWTLIDIDAYLRRSLRKQGQDPRQTLTMANGMATHGLDALADLWVDRVPCGRSWFTEPHPADWIRNGRAAGFIRNQQMVARGADACVAWIKPCSKSACTRPKPHGSHGATDCADRAEKAGIPTWRWAL